MSDFRLQVFYSVAKNLSFTKASQELFISQPATTKHISRLEEQYRVRLFDRQGSRISLTRAGEVMLKHCERLLSDYNRLSYAMHLLNNEHAGQLRLGASTTISQYVLPECLADFLKAHPKADISLINGNSRFIEHELSSNNIDLGMVEGIHHLPGLNHSAFYEDELIILTGARSSYAAKDELSADELREAPLVMRERGSGSLEAIAKTLSDFNLPLSELNIKIYLGSTEAIKLFVKSTEALCILSRTAVTRELEDGSLKELRVPGLTFRRNFCFVTGAGTQGPLIERFQDFVRKELTRKQSGR